jgi:hypothetical protein
MFVFITFLSVTSTMVYAEPNAVTMSSGYK